jgi:hypothetical protein
VKIILGERKFAEYLKWVAGHDLHLGFSCKCGRGPTTDARAFCHHILEDHLKLPGSVDLLAKIAYDNLKHDGKFSCPYDKCVFGPTHLKNVATAHLVREHMRRGGVNIEAEIVFLRNKIGLAPTAEDTGEEEAN